MQRLGGTISMKRILFVDDEAQALLGLEATLYKQRRHWEMVFVDSAPAALDALAATPFDVVVSDMRMPIMDGAQLLSQVKAHFPSSARMVLSGQSERQAVLRAVSSTQQFLSKPMDLASFRSRIERVCTLRSRVDDSSCALVGSIDQLPVASDTYQKLDHAMRRPSVPMAELRAIAEGDPALAAKALQLANSAFFGHGCRTSSIREAVDYLGRDVMQLLALSTHVHAISQRSQRARSPKLHDLQRRAHLVAQVVPALLPEHCCVEEAVSAALLHNVGRLVLETVGRSSDEQTEPTDLSQAAIGALLLGTWGLPLELVEVVAYHTTPSAALQPARVDLLTALHVVTTLLSGIEQGLSDPMCRVDLAFCERAGVLDKLPAWRKFVEDLVHPDGVNALASTVPLPIIRAHKPLA